MSRPDAARCVRFSRWNSNLCWAIYIIICLIVYMLDNINHYLHTTTSTLLQLLPLLLLLLLLLHYFIIIIIVVVAEAAEHVLEWGGGTGVRGHLTYKKNNYCPSGHSFLIHCRPSMYPSAGRALHTLGRKFFIAPLGTPS